MKHKCTVVLIFLFAFCNSNADDAISVVGLKYHEAREKLMNSRWSPMRTNTQEGAMLHIKETYPELLDCAIGKAHCAFGFIKPNNECKYIFTTGNEINNLHTYATYGGCDTFHINGVKRCGTTEHMTTLTPEEVGLLIRFFKEKSLDTDTAFPHLNITAENICSYTVLTGPRCGGLNETYHESLFNSQFYVLSEGKKYRYDFSFTITPAIDYKIWPTFKYMKEIFNGKAMYQHDIWRQDNSKNTNPIERISRDSDQELCQ